jgi:3D (Asp-Asp-Asp) domain-containing protein
MQIIDMGILPQVLPLTARQRFSLSILVGVLAFTGSRVDTVLAYTQDEAKNRASVSETVLAIQDDVRDVGIQLPPRYLGELERANKVPAVAVRAVEMTAYTSEVGQTDGSPFITANGTRVRDGVIAANFLKFHTRIRIPELYGDKIFVVMDRMNSRYTQRVDIWMENRREAVRFGVKRQVKIEIL